MALLLGRKLDVIGPEATQPLTARLGDNFGRSDSFVLATLVPMAGNLACGLAGSRVCNSAVAKPFKHFLAILGTLRAVLERRMMPGDGVPIDDQCDDEDKSQKRSDPHLSRLCMLEWKIRLRSTEHKVPA
ncbi:Major facilitator superfamily domain general substrate transporter [Penicillium paradoxum]|uniref:Major facilitator superfamily domain general substrate transporter n=1 Tax=Penicillium paradoxum TaxID=176176 RepID=UPI002548330E|nr:Major facilitator superfamily domain general substrate transporter [Penicillium paradoxum]KAJ5787334.1 Major facilitator superfamily domain general substrate transporter [Penicillium paradoxum]